MKKVQYASSSESNKRVKIEKEAIAIKAEKPFATSEVVFGLSSSVFIIGSTELEDNS